jgi:hypothetical protein
MNITEGLSNMTSLHGSPGNFSDKTPVTPIDVESAATHELQTEANRGNDDRPTKEAPAVSIVCQLSGEMGNFLDIYAHCHAISRLLDSKFGVKSRIVLRHALDRKNLRTVQDLKACFPFFRSRNFEEANTPLFDQRMLEQSKLLLGDEDLRDLLTATFAPETGGAYRFLQPNVVIDALGRFASFTAQHGVASPSSETAASTVAPSSLTNRSIEDERQQEEPTISLPFLYVSWLYIADTFKDDYMDDFLSLYAFQATTNINSSSQCCAVLPDDDETVFVRCEFE